MKVCSTRVTQGTMPRSIEAGNIKLILKAESFYNFRSIFIPVLQAS